MATSTYGTPYVQGSDLVSAYPTASSNLATRVDEVSYKRNGLNAQTGTTYTLVVGDAGKTITLSNASAVAVTLPQDSTADLPDGAVVTFYNLGAGTVTISQGTGATLQGGSITLEQYAVTSVIKLSANTYGKVDGSDAPGLVLVAQNTFSAASSVNINNCFTSTYDNYRMIIEMTPAAASPNIFFRLRSGGTDDTGANYAYQYVYGTGTSVIGARATAQTGAWFYTSSTSYRAISSYDISAPALARQTSVVGHQVYASGTVELITWANNHNQATAYDGITIYPASSTITGTIRIYGYRNA